MPSSLLRPEQFHGGWALVDWRIEYSNGGVTRPFGKDAIGQILYTEDGHMSATVSRADRQPIKQSNVRNASDSDRADRFDSYFHYAGTWSINGETVIHDVQFSMNPNMVGTQQIRKAEFKGQNWLWLSAYEPLKNGEPRHHILEWQRAT
jgi:hypothetical protein